MAKTVAELLVERLLAWNVDTIFGLPGDGVNGIVQALRSNADRIRFIQVRHQEAAAFAAVGYAKYTGRLGVCLATSGPGDFHLLNGLYDVKCDGQPVLAITAHTCHDLIGTHHRQDVDLDQPCTDLSVYHQRIIDPACVVNVVDEAIKAALGRHGVAHITVPNDAQGWTRSDAVRLDAHVPHHRADLFISAYPLPPPDQLQRAVDIINDGDHAAILIGRGCPDARHDIPALDERAAAPIATALPGQGVVPDDFRHIDRWSGLPRRETLP